MLEYAKTYIGRKILIDLNLLTTNNSLSIDVTILEVTEYREFKDNVIGYFVLLETRNYYTYHHFDLEEFLFVLSKGVVLEQCADGKIYPLKSKADS